MMQPDPNTPSDPNDLTAPIAELLDAFKALQCAAAGVDSENQVPDSVEQLDEVLQHTEEATGQIIQSAMAIQSAVDESAADDAVKQEVGEKITAIFESCTFQDISGQRIKKVMTCLDVLKTRIKQLESIAGNQSGNNTQKPEVELAKSSDDPESLKNGPQMTEDVPSQEDVDKFFS